MATGPNDSTKERDESSLSLLAIVALFIFFPFVANLVAGRLHLGLIEASALSIAPFVLVSTLAAGGAIASYKSLCRFIRGLKRCPHGVRNANLLPCPQCLEEKTRHEECCAKELAEREAKEKRMHESKALRSAEIARLSKAWLARSESYFSMSPREFEDAIARLFMELGYEVTQTPYSNDGGKDAIISKDSRKFVVECKRYDREALTGRRDLQILVAAMHDVSADGAFFVSTGRFARTAIEYARDNEITLYDGDHISILVNEAFGIESTIPLAKVMCESCGEIALFDIFGGQAAMKKCKNLHDVICNIKSGDLNVATTLESPVCPRHKVPMRIVKSRWGEFWGCPRYPNCRTRISIAQNKYVTRVAAGKGNPNHEDRGEHVTFGGQVNCITLARSRQWSIWAPILTDNDEPDMSLAVPCGPTAPNREQYRDRLYDYMRELVLASPRAAEKTIRDFFPSLIGPDLAFEIAYSDQVSIFLDQIDWLESNLPRKLEDGEDLPTLLKILATIDMIV